MEMWILRGVILSGVGGFPHCLQAKVMNVSAVFYGECSPSKHWVVAA
jgi:hypothetical protein